MHLKIILVPFLIIMVLVVSIAYIEPDFRVMQAKKAELKIKQAQLGNMETLLANINSLVNSLDSQNATEQFVTKFLAQERDQDRVIDSFNFSALQSGVIINGIKIEELPEVDFVPAENLDGTPLTSPDGGELLNADGTPMMPALPPVVPKTYTAKVEVKGNYENIKNFLNRTAHMNRFYKLQHFSVVIPKELVESDETEDIANNLVGTFEGGFQYLEPQKAKDALRMSIFQKSTIDMSAASQAESWVTNIVPNLEKPATGKPNPFQ